MTALTRPQLDRYRALAESGGEDVVPRELAEAVLVLVDALEGSRDALNSQIIAVAQELSERWFNESWHPDLERFTWKVAHGANPRECAEFIALTNLTGTWPCWPEDEACPCVMPIEEFARRMGER